MIAKEPLPLTREVFPHLFKDPTSLPPSMDPFTITTATGFMPSHQPQVELPAVFKPLTTLLEAMPIVRSDGSAGLLATFELGPMIDTKGCLPDLTDKIDEVLVTADGERDLGLITAAFRDYSFLASAYLLEPCWEKWSQDHDGGYGLGRQVLPACIAGPMVKCADILNIPPFLSYAASYALYNYTISGSNNSSPLPSDYKSLSLIRGFERGLDPTSSEAGFILTHIDMVRHTPGLVEGAVQLLDTLTEQRNNTPGGGAGSSAAPITLTNPTHLSPILTSLDTMLESMTAIESSMARMWTNSLPSQYISFRTFIFGITSQSMFPSGVKYQIPPHLHSQLTNLDPAAFDQPISFRGESGANDAIIPLLDSLLSIPFPSNPLTTILHEFRAYRPLPHREFLAHVRSRASTLDVCTLLAAHGGLETRYRLLKLLNHIRSFRWRHWTFAREYIIRRTKHATATGGSPIVTWLPNQLDAVMAMMEKVWAEQFGAQGEMGDQEDQGQRDMVKELVEMMAEVREQREQLKTEVEKWCIERGEK